MASASARRPTAGARAIVSGMLAAIQGNLDPLALVAGGETLDRAVDEVLADFRGTRHIFNLGHGIRSWTPVEHVERMVARIRGG